MRSRSRAPRAAALIPAPQDPPEDLDDDMEGGTFTMDDVQTDTAADKARLPALPPPEAMPALPVRRRPPGPCGPGPGNPAATPPPRRTSLPAQRRCLVRRRGPPASSLH